jgi:translocation and assembly module TamA
LGAAPLFVSLAALLVAGLVPAGAAAQERASINVTWQGPEPLRSQLEKLLPPPVAESADHRAALRPWVRDVRRRVPEIAAAEGYFSAKVEVDWEGERENATIVVESGPRTLVSKIDIEIAGDLSGEGDGRDRRRQELREAWALKEGMPFRSSDWEEAKRGLREKLVEVDYASGDLVESEAQVDADTATAQLHVKVDSGPRFTLGDPVFSGLNRYPEAILTRAYNIESGERYRQDRLIELQRALQAGPWFSSVVVDIDRDPENANRAPVKVTVVERPRYDVGLAVGFGTDAGIRGEVSLRNRNFLDRGFDLQSALRADRQQQLGYADVYLPPSVSGSVPTWLSSRFEDVKIKDSTGVLAEHTDIQGLVTSRWAVAGYRQFIFGTVIETRIGLSYQIERSKPEGSVEDINRALAPVVAFTWRHVDDMLDPHRGGVLNLQFAGAAHAFLSTQDFFKAYAQYQRWFDLTRSDQLILRGEIGRTFAFERQGIPQDFLFRAGGSRSVRGYDYQSLGAKEGNAVVGGRYLATASAEVVHWLNPVWGAAAFFDIGDAADSAKEWTPHRSYGLGARYKTPAGPLALDVAYAEADHKVNIVFSVMVAF